MCVCASAPLIRPSPILSLSLIISVSELLHLSHITFSLSNCQSLPFFPFNSLFIFTPNKTPASSLPWLLSSSSSRSVFTCLYICFLHPSYTVTLFAELPHLLLIVVTSCPLFMAVIITTTLFIFLMVSSDHCLFSLLCSYSAGLLLFLPLISYIYPTKNKYLSVCLPLYCHSSHSLSAHCQTVYANGTAVKIKHRGHLADAKWG